MEQVWTRKTTTNSMGCKPPGSPPGWRPKHLERFGDSKLKPSLSHDEPASWEGASLPNSWQYKICISHLGIIQIDLRVIAFSKLDTAPKGSMVYKFQIWIRKYFTLPNPSSQTNKLPVSLASISWFPSKNHLFAWFVTCSCHIDIPRKISPKCNSRDDHFV